MARDYEYEAMDKERMAVEFEVVSSYLLGATEEQ
jgi:hypothetical protein